MIRCSATLVVAFLFVSAGEPGYKVKVAGEMRKIMQQGELSAVIKLDTLRIRQHVFGLGPAAALKGEIITLDGVTYVSEVVADNIVNSIKSSAEASMFVYAAIDGWDEKSIFEEVASMQSLEQLVESIAQRSGLDLTQPLPFTIKASRGTFSYHVIDWKEGTVHTMASHKQFAKAGTITEEDVTILGFYSSKHQGVIAPHTSKIHAHILRNGDKLVGHLDDVQFSAEFLIGFPKSK